MDKILISNSQGESGIVNVVRYFKNNGVDYLIYSLNEVDEAGYTRLYVTKLNGTDGVYNADTLNDNEWNEVKNLVKVIVKANKEGVPAPIEDLNPKKINNLFLKDKKVFKLNASLVTDLSSNKPNFNVEEEYKNGNQFNNTFESIEAPSLETPAQSVVEPQQTSPFETSVQPTFDFNAQPVFEIPTPSFETPAQQSFEIPVQPTFETTDQPTFDFNTQPTFEIPTSNFEAIAQPTFENSVQPTFDFNTQPTFEIPTPSFETPVQSTFDFSKPLQSNETNNFQELYNQELAKNESMQNEIEKLNQEIAKYKNMMNELKNIIGE